MSIACGLSMDAKIEVFLKEHGVVFELHEHPPICILNNRERDVKLFIDREAWEAELVNIHPNENTASLVLDRESFHRMIEALGVEKEML